MRFPSFPAPTTQPLCSHPGCVRGRAILDPISFFVASLVIFLICWKLYVYGLNWRAWVHEVPDTTEWTILIAGALVGVPGLMLSELVRAQGHRSLNHD